MSDTIDRLVRILDEERSHLRESRSHHHQTTMDLMSTRHRLSTTERDRENAEIIIGNLWSHCHALVRLIPKRRLKEMPLPPRNYKRID